MTDSRAEQTPGDQTCPIRFLGLACRFCHDGIPHPGDIANLPEDKPGSVWSVVMKDLK